MEELISIIVPVYNVEKYLDRCVNSIVNQTYKNLEIILVDDGSTDSSGKKCDEYAKKDNRIKVIHQKNSKLPAARNAGLNICKGKYIGFCDSDDYIKEDMFETLYNNLKKGKVQISACGTWKVVNGKVVKYQKNKKTCEKISIETALRYLNVYGMIGNGVCNKLYNRDIIGETRFNINYQGGEDILFNYEVFLKTDYIYWNSTEYYYYVQNESSITHSEKVILGLINATKDIINIIERKKPELYGFAVKNYLMALFKEYNKILLNGIKDEKNMKYFSDEMRKYWKKRDFTLVQFKKRMQFNIFIHFPIIYNSGMRLIGKCLHK